MAGRIFINGELVAPEAARVSVFDRGFLYGDSVYETLRVYHGVPFALDAHIERLWASGQRIFFELPWSREHVRSAVADTLAAAGLTEAYVRIVATRGAGTVGLDPSLATDPNLVVFALELPELPPSMYESGRSAWLVSVRRNLKRAIDPEAKTGNYINSVMAVREARARGADEAIMLDAQGRVAEASSANVFARLGGGWVTPPMDVGILGGITRRTLLELAQREGIVMAERMLSPDELRGAAEIFLCSTVRELLPIVKLDGAPVGDGAVGEHTRRLHTLYRAEVEARCAPA